MYIQAGDKTEQGILTYTGNGALPPQTKHILLCKVTQRNGSFLRLGCWSATALCQPLPLPLKPRSGEVINPTQTSLNRPLHPATPLTGDAAAGLKTLLLLLKAVLVAIATTIGEAGTVFTEWVVIPAWDVLLAGPSVWQFCTEPCRKGARGQVSPRSYPCCRPADPT